METKFIQIQNRRIEYVRILPTALRAPLVPPIVLLHEGLGSIGMWRNFPQRLADSCGAEVVAYSRFGYGGSDTLGPDRNGRAVDYMHDEALKSLPEFLDKLKIDRPFLVGHSDGGSIALIQAGADASARRALSGVVVMAPHVYVEDKAVEGILRTRRLYETTSLRDRLARYHADVDRTFWGWFDIWTNPDFRTWNIEAYLPQIDCPVLAIQGEDDEYGTLEQIERIARQTGIGICPRCNHRGTPPDMETLVLPECGHSPHKDQTDQVLASIARFISN